MKAPKLTIKVHRKKDGATVYNILLGAQFVEEQPTFFLASERMNEISAGITTVKDNHRKYDVVVSQTIVRTATITVDAQNPTEASTLALKKTNEVQTWLETKGRPVALLTTP